MQSPEGALEDLQVGDGDIRNGADGRTISGTLEEGHDAGEIRIHGTHATRGV